MEKLKLIDELKTIGLTDEQCIRTIDLINKLPIHIMHGIINTKVSINDGIITVEPCTPYEDIML